MTEGNKFRVDWDKIHEKVDECMKVADGAVMIKSPLHEDGEWVPFDDVFTIMSDTSVKHKRKFFLYVVKTDFMYEEIERLRHLCDTLFIYAHNMEIGQTTINKSNGEPLSIMDFEDEMTWIIGDV